MEQSDRQQATPLEESKPLPARLLAPSDSVRTYENRSNSGRSLHRLAPKKHIDSPMPNRTNFVIISPAPSQGIVVQGRHFQHAQMPSHVRRPLARDFPPTQPPVEMDSIVLTCPDVSEDECLNVKRRIVQRRQDCRTFSSPPELVQSWPSPYPLICLNCKKPKEQSEKCTNCGSIGPASSTPTPRPPIRLNPTQVQTRTQPELLQGLQPVQGFYRPVSTLPMRVTKTQNNGTKRASEISDPIVLSSDDDEEDEADNASTGSSRLDNISPRPADSAHSSPAPSGGKVEAAVKNAVEQEELGADFFEDVNMKISIPRRARMKDQFGKTPPEPPRQKKPKLPSKCSSIILECRSIRIGTLRRLVRKPVVFTTEHIQLDTEGPEGQAESVVFRASELVSCEWCSVRKLPVLFFQSSEQECSRLREQLQMSRGLGGDWIDCSSTHPDEKYIVLIFENGLPMEQQVILEDILGEIGQNNNLSDFPAKISFDEANLRLVNYNKATERKDDKVKPARSPPKPSPVPVRTRMSTRHKPNSFESDDEMTELQPTFTGPIVKLMVYPPPPAKGGITVTNEDLHCLNDGEFLNDVIIDFYLKYLVLEKLKKEDAQRIHVFSSFFYKRLNQRERRNGPDPSNLPLQKKKHNRVKTWTRHVDLFQKDFIFVPINESAHWYLAVICFPGLERPLLEPNPQFQGENPSGDSQTEEPIPDHCRPLSPCTSLEPEEPEESPDNQEQTYTSELHRISVCYGSRGRDTDPFAFSDDHSSCQDECSEDGALADDASNDSSSLTSKPTICKQPCILIMDSLRGPARSTVVKTLREYLEVEWEVRRGSQRSFNKDVMKGSSPRVPQQDNFSDCGVYVLQYVESFFQNPIPSFTLPLNLSDWFPPQRMKTKREEIKELILRLQTQQQPPHHQENTQNSYSAPGSSEEPEIQEPSPSSL
ncbi:sentrin-specific protease 6 isoform X2 [Periophthalmus magnuspinnatus]|nr:sentrin-specific protease 6 isoform X2 [Periophthalmus magnuspinnatus]